MLSQNDSHGAPDEPLSPSPPAPDGGPDIDLERAMWDLDYRAQVLEMLRRAREDGGCQPAAAPGTEPIIDMKSTT
jgi:hypothetical protein